MSVHEWLLFRAPWIPLIHLLAYPYRVLLAAQWKFIADGGEREATRQPRQGIDA